MSLLVACSVPGCSADGLVCLVENAGTPAPKVIVWTWWRHGATLRGVRVEVLGAHLPIVCSEHRRKS